MQCGNNADIKQIARPCRQAGRSRRIRPLCGLFLGQFDRERGGNVSRTVNNQIDNFADNLADSYMDASIHGRRTLTRRWVREIDRRAVEEYGMSGLVLMENAARGAVDVLLGLGCGGPVAIVCGKGNNAGDGFAMARHLENRGVPVRVLLAADPGELCGDAAANYRILAKCRLPMVVLEPFDDARLARELAGCAWIVDALLGTGSTGSPRPPLDRIIRHLNGHAAAKKLAADVPSGLDCDTGEAAHPTFAADHTVTFVAPKTGLLTDEARRWVGQLHVVDIGAPRILVEEVLQLAGLDAT